MFERACQRWHIGALYVARRMGRGGCRAAQVIGLLQEYASRDDFFDPNGGLLSFAGLDFLALLAGVNEKTIRRTINDLEAVGVVRVQHRRETSNLYYLVLPTDAGDHLARCDLAIAERRRARQNRSRKPKDGCAQVSTHPGHLGTDSTPKCPTYFERYSESNSSLKGQLRCRLEDNLDLKDSQEERSGNSQPLSDNPNPPIASSASRDRFQPQGLWKFWGLFRARPSPPRRCISPMRRLKLRVWVRRRRALKKSGLPVGALGDWVRSLSSLRTLMTQTHPPNSQCKEGNVRTVEGVQFETDNNRSRIS